MKITSKDETIYSNVDLYVNPEKSKKLKGNREGIGLRFKENGDPFTGTQELRFVENDNLFSKMVYEEGVLKSTTAYHKDGSLKSKYEYDFIDDQFKTIKQFNEDSILVEEWISPTENNPLGTIKQWHENGQIKFKAYFSGNIQYQGLMTLYDEQGNILEQERYEDGELIEKIK